MCRTPFYFKVQPYLFSHTTSSSLEAFLVRRLQFRVYFWRQHNITLIIASLNSDSLLYLCLCKKSPNPHTKKSQAWFWLIWTAKSSPVLTTSQYLYLLLTNVQFICSEIPFRNLSRKTREPHEIQKKMKSWEEGRTGKNEKTCQEWIYCFVWSKCANLNTQIQTQKHAIQAGKNYCQSDF